MRSGLCATYATPQRCEWIWDGNRNGPAGGPFNIIIIKKIEIMGTLNNKMDAL